MEKAETDHRPVIKRMVAGCHWKGLEALVNDRDAAAQYRELQLSGAPAG